MESVSSLYGQITALRRGGLSPKDDEKKLDAHVRVVMRTMKERLASLTEGPLQVRPTELHCVQATYLRIPDECRWDCRVRRTFTVRCKSVAIDVGAGKNTALGIGATMMKRAVSWMV